MEFKKQLRLTIQHEYFDQAAVGALTIRPTDDCKRQLKNYNLLVKTEQAGITILKAAETADVVLDFLVFTTDSNFDSYTDLPAKGRNEIYLFSNPASGKNMAGLVTTVIPLANFVQDAGQSLLGMIKLTLTNKTPAELTLNLAAKAIKWRYYVVSDPSWGTIVVDGKLSDIAFSRKEYSKKTPDTVVDALVTNYPAGVVSFFESDKAVAYSSGARKNIQLKKETSNAVMIKHLPNPALHANGITIIKLF